jgi:glycerol-1-phosphate dehydrogenase [NAD(P)+]
VTQDSLGCLMAGQFDDPDGGPVLDPLTAVVAIEDSLAGTEAELVAGLGLGDRLAMVCDDDTHRVLGARVVDALAAVATISEVRLPGQPHADGETAAALRRETAACDALIAVGSGSINDLCKYAAALDNKPYAVFATAPSMNGYTSVNAAITIDGHKKSIQAAAAAGVFMDLEVLAAAPPRMIRSGLGDSLCRPTAQADWLLAHMLLGEPYREAPFALLAEDEGTLFDGSAALMRGDLDVMRALARVLTLSGFGMTIARGSQPASQGEHLIGHYAEMRADPAWPPSFHGEQIGVATLTMARLQERMLADGPPRLAACAADEASVIDHFGRDLGAACWAEFRLKRLDEAAARTLNTRIDSSWDAIAARIAAISLPAARLEDVLGRAGAPRRPEDLGWGFDFYDGAVRHAREIRNRYTFLDLAADSGVL